MHLKLETKHYTLHTKNASLNLIHDTLHTIHYTLLTTHYTLHAKSYTICTTHYALHTTLHVCSPSDWGRLQADKVPPTAGISLRLRQAGTGWQTEPALGLRLQRTGDSWQCSSVFDSSASCDDRSTTETSSRKGKRAAG